MARQSRGRLHFGRKQSPTSRRAAAVANAEAQANRRKSRAKKWRERFCRIALSSYSSSWIAKNVCNLFRFSADYMRAATSSRFVGTVHSGRQLRVEGLELRQMLSTTPWNLGAPGNSQSAPSVVYVDDTWAGTTLGTDADGAGNIVPNWTGIGGNANGSEFGVDEFATIQDAINAA